MNELKVLVMISKSEQFAVAIMYNTQGVLEYYKSRYQCLKGGSRDMYKIMDASRYDVMENIERRGGASVYDQLMTDAK